MMLFFQSLEKEKEEVFTSMKKNILKAVVGIGTVVFMGCGMSMPVVNADGLTGNVTLDPGSSGESNGNDGNEVNDIQRYFIYAENVAQILVGKTSDQQLIEAASVQAMNLIGGSAGVVVKNTTIHPNKTGSYEVTFAVAEDLTVETTVKVNVVEELTHAGEDGSTDFPHSSMTRPDWSFQ